MANRLEVDGRVLNIERNLGAEDREKVLSAFASYLEGDAAGWKHLLDFVVANSPPEGSVALDAAARIAARHHALEGEEPLLRSWLGLFALRADIARQLGGEPRLMLEGAAHAEMVQARIRGEAMQTIWREPMLSPKDAAVALGAKATNREKVRQHRRRSWLLGLPSGGSYVYPAFQFDPRTRDVCAEVRAVNELLRASDDPWGVASWWVSRNARVGARPIELVGTERAAELAELAGAVTEPIG